MLTLFFICQRIGREVGIHVGVFPERVNHHRGERHVQWIQRHHKGIHHVIADKRRDERKQAGKEQQAYVKPEQFGIHFVDVVDDGMMIDPENSDDEETEQEGKELWRELEHGNAKGFKGTAFQFGDVQFEDENRQDDGEHAIAKGFEAGFSYGISPVLELRDCAPILGACARNCQ